MGMTCKRHKSVYSRRAMLDGVASSAILPGQVNHAYADLDDRPWYFRDEDEARWLASACDVRIPEDDYPNASQVGVVHYINFQLATDYGVVNGLYPKRSHEPGTPEQGCQFPFHGQIWRLLPSYLDMRSHYIACRGALDENQDLVPVTVVGVSRAVVSDNFSDPTCRSAGRAETATGTPYRRSRFDTMEQSCKHAF